MDKYFPMNLKHLRKSRGISLDTLAYETGLSKSVLSGYEKGENSPSLKSLVEIVRYFGCSMSDITERDLSQNQSQNIVNEPQMIYGELDRLRIENAALREALQEIGKGINQKIKTKPL